MFNNVLFITDNQHICNAIRLIVSQQFIEKVNYTFAISPFSDAATFFSAEDEIIVTDLRKESDVSMIISDYDLVISAHCKQLFPAKLVETVKCINIHPGLNPYNRGWYPQVFSIINGLPAGATIHEMDHELDHGPIIASEEIAVDSFDTSLSLYDKIVQKEIELFRKHFESIVLNNYSTVLPHSEGNVNRKSDFNKLLEIDLEENAKVGDVIDKLRALTHGNFNNAFFIDPKTNRRVYLQLVLKPENDER